MPQGREKHEPESVAAGAVVNGRGRQTNSSADTQDCPGLRSIARRIRPAPLVMHKRVSTFSKFL